MRVTDVFTPSTPARFTFVEREAVNEQVVDALRTPGKQLIVYGHSGCGKTTLLVNKLCQIYERHIISHCTVTSTFESLLLDAFDQLCPYFVSEESQKTQEQTSLGLTAEVLAIKGQLVAVSASEHATKHQRALPLQLSLQNLARFLGASRTAWILDDFHKVSSDERLKLAQAMKVFVDLGSVYPDLKLVAIGAVDTPRKVLEADPEMRRRIAEIRVPLMTRHELEQILFKGEQLLNVSIPYRVKSAISHYSSGLAAICHQLSLNLCRAAGVEAPVEGPVDLDESHLTRALEMYVQGESASLKTAFERAIRRKRKGQFDNCRLILKALAHHGEEGAQHHELLSHIREGFDDFPPGNLTQYLRELQTKDRGEIVRYDEVSLKYSFSDPLFRVFTIAALSGGTDLAMQVISQGDIGRAIKVLEAAVAELMKRNGA